MLAFAGREQREFGRAAQKASTALPDLPVQSTLRGDELYVALELSNGALFSL